MALEEVKHPPFTRRKKQLEKVEVDWSRQLSQVQIDVERAIGVFFYLLYLLYYYEYYCI